jgi:hypothetical protein
VQVLVSGRLLWRAEVVLWIEPPTKDQIDALLDAVRSATTRTSDEDVPRLLSVTTAHSYDMQPPPPETGIGVSAWVRADSVGGAAETAWKVVEAAAAATLGPPPRLWDLRLIPREAILSTPDTGVPLAP